MNTNVHRDPQKLLRKSGLGTLLYAIISAFSMFSILPMPELQWDEKRSHWLLAAFPSVGFVLGFLLLAARWLFSLFSRSALLPAAALTLLGMVLTGAIHLDGFGDALDAIFSHRGREEELKIMKDPHSGSMAVTGIALFLILELALYAEIYLQIKSPRQLLSLPILFALERCLSAYLLLRLPRASSSRMGAMIADDTPQALPNWLLIQAAFCGLALLLTQGLRALILLGAAALISERFAAFCRKRYGGMTGDLAGCFLCLEEGLYLFLWLLINL